MDAITINTYRSFSSTLALLCLVTIMLAVSSPVRSIEPIQPITHPDDLDLNKVMLGRQLFEDKRLSKKENISCSDCHLLEKGGADGLPKSIGTHGETTSRNTPTVFNVGLNVALFWDGRANTLEEQIDSVIRNPKEMDGDWNLIIERLEDDPVIVSSALEAYNTEISQMVVTDAISEYLRSLVTINSPFDKYLSGDTSAINKSAISGYEKFKSHGCVSCHQGRNVGGNLFQRAGLMAQIAEHRGVSNVFEDDLGRYAVTGRERDKFVFRVPSLRNVALTGPYFHNGSVGDLREAIRLMAFYQLGHPIPDADVEDIFMFLHSLTGSIPDYAQ